MDSSDGSRTQPRRTVLGSQSQVQHQQAQQDGIAHPIDPSASELGVLPQDGNATTVDPFPWYSEIAAGDMMFLTDDLMWGGDDILASMESLTGDGGGKD